MHDDNAFAVVAARRIRSSIDSLREDWLAELNGDASVLLPQLSPLVPALLRRVATRLEAGSITAPFRAPLWSARQALRELEALDTVVVGVLREMISEVGDDSTATEIRDAIGRTTAALEELHDEVLANHWPVHPLPAAAPEVWRAPGFDFTGLCDGASRSPARSTPDEFD